MTGEDYHQMNDTANKAILQELIDGSNDEVVSAILRCYQIGASDGLIKKEFTKWKVTGLKQTALYLNIETEGMLKADIISEIIGKIESLLMELCGVCLKYYNNRLEDNPAFKCLICKQGCHQPCYEEVYRSFLGLNEKFHKSLHFICSSCQKVHESVENTEKDAANNKVKKSPTKSNATPNDTESESNSDDETRSEPGDQNPIDNLLEVQPKPKSEILCPEYKWKKCENYNKCPFKHPARCRRFLRNGKCPNKQNCEFNHPPLCKYSLHNKKCFNQECRFFHLVGTLRRKPEEEQPPARNSAPGQPPNVWQHQKNENHPQNVHQSNQNPQPENNHRNDQKPTNEETPNYLSFLVSLITKVKEDIGKEIAELKQQQIQNNKPPVAATTIPNQPPSPPTTIPSTSPVLINPYTQALLMNSHLASHQQ